MTIDQTETPLIQISYLYCSAKLTSYDTTWTSSCVSQVLSRYIYIDSNVKGKLSPTLIYHRPNIIIYSAHYSTSYTFLKAFRRWRAVQPPYSVGEELVSQIFYRHTIMRGIFVFQYAYNTYCAISVHVLQELNPGVNTYRQSSTVLPILLAYISPRSAKRNALILHEPGPRHRQKWVSIIFLMSRASTIRTPKIQ